MTTLLLIRHAETEYVKEGKLAGRLPGIHLTDEGKNHARLLAEKLSLFPIGAIYCSPLERAVETAEALAEKLKLHIMIKNGLTEINFGRWEGQCIHDLKLLSQWKIVQKFPSQMVFEDGESFVEAQNRIVEEIEFIQTQQTKNEIIACFTHSDVIKLAIAHYIGLPLDMFQRIRISPASISAIIFTEETNELITINNELKLSLAATS